MYHWVSYVGVPFTGIYYNWQYLQSLVVRIPVSNPSAKAYSLVENAKKMGNRMPFLYRGAQFPYFRRCIKPGLMIPSISITVSGFGQLKCIYYISIS